MKKASIIIRTKNEEKWITSCLTSIFNQDYADFEVIIVDNCSDDKTVEKAKEWDVKVITIKDFKPGKAINMGFKEAKGDYLICLSAHCIPKDDKWLENLVEGLEEEDVAGIYGKQIPTSSSHYLDKRDLFLTFGNDKIIQQNDSFFHNANSAIRRSIWEAYPFDDEVTNIEDRIWGSEIISNKLKIIYEPNAAVFHHHGIHQEADKKRAKKIVHIMEADEFPTESLYKYKGKTKDILIIFDREAYSPLRKKLLFRVLKQCQEAQVFTDIIFSGIDKEACELAKSQDLLVNERDKKSYEDPLELVLKNCLLQFEKKFYIPDSVTVSSVNYPFRNSNNFKQLVESFYESAFLPTLFSHEEKRVCFSLGGENEIAINNELLPRKLEQASVLISPFGFGCTMTPSDLRAGNFLQKRVNLLPALTQFSMLEVNSEDDLKNMEISFE